MHVSGLKFQSCRGNATFPKKIKMSMGQNCSTHTQLQLQSLSLSTSTSTVLILVLIKTFASTSLLREQFLGQQDPDHMYVMQWVSIDLV